jgi:hypothetical protein
MPLPTIAKLGPLHRLCFVPQAQAAGAVSGGGSSKKGGEPNEFWWDVAGWVTLGAIIVGVLMLSKGSSPPKA